MKYSNELICNILEFIENNLNRKITIEEISLKFAYDKYYLMKLFKREIGITIITYMNQLRINNSIIDIQNTHYSLTRIALKNGFYSIEYFSEMFHKVLGVSPRDYLFYCKNRFLRDETKADFMLIHWVQLQIMVEKVSQYKKNRKPNVLPVRKLSIFS